MGKNNTFSNKIGTEVFIEEMSKVNRVPSDRYIEHSERRPNFGLADTLMGIFGFKRVEYGIEKGSIVSDCDNDNA